MNENNCNGCKYSKKLKYSGWPCCTCNKCEVEVRADERKNAEQYFQNSDYWNDYLAKVIADERAKAFDECIQIVTEFCGGLPNSKLISALEHSKEQK